MAAPLGRDPQAPLPDGNVPAPPRSPAPARDSNRRTARISSEQLFAGAAELHIEHRGALYRLKQTQLGKLILTK